MVYLLLAILSSATISILMRISADKVSAKLSMLAANYLICALLGAAYAGFALICPDVSGFSVTVSLGVVGGVLFLVSFVLFQSNTRKNGIVLSSIFMKLGLLIPILVSVLLFRELPTALQSAGFCIAVCAIVLINLKREARSKGFGFGLLLLLLMGGGADSMAKLFERFGPAALSDQFLFYTFFVALLLCLVLVLRNRERPDLQALLFGALIGIPNFFSSKFLLAALTRLPAVVVYPTFSVATVLIVTLTGVTVFRERLSKLQWGCLGATVVALVMLNL